jgi:hypothetical protein
MRLKKQTRGPFPTAILVLFLLMLPTVAFGESAILRDNGEIWRYIGPPCTSTTNCPGWILIDSGILKPTQIAARTSVLFLRQENGSIWEWDGSSHCDAAG